MRPIMFSAVLLTSLYSTGAMPELSAQQAEPKGTTHHWGPVRFTVPEGWRPFPLVVSNENIEVLIERAEARRPAAPPRPPLQLNVCPRMRQGPHTPARHATDMLQYVLKEQGGKNSERKQTTIGKKVSAVHVRFDLDEKRHEVAFFQAGKYVVSLGVEYVPNDRETRDAFLTMTKSIAIGKGTLKEPIER